MQRRGGGKRLCSHCHLEFLLNRVARLFFEAVVVCDKQILPIGRSTAPNNSS